MRVCAGIEDVLVARLLETRQASQRPSVLDVGDTSPDLLALVSQTAPDRRSYGFIDKQRLYFVVRNGSQPQDLVKILNNCAGILLEDDANRVAGLREPKAKLVTRSNEKCDMAVCCPKSKSA